MMALIVVKCYTSMLRQIQDICNLSFVFFDTISLIVVINLLNSFREVIVLADLDWQFWTLEACQFDSSLPLYNRQTVSSFLFSYGLSNRSEFTLSSL